MKNTRRVVVAAVLLLTAGCCENPGDCPDWPGLVNIWPFSVLFDIGP